MKTVCIDTDILGWAIKGYSTDGDKEKVKESQILKTYLTRKDIKIVIPTIVLAEMLCDVKDKTKREELVKDVATSFPLASYNLASARVFGDINAAKLPQEKEKLAKYRKENGVLKCKMKNDWNICATALAHKCDTIFTNNVKDFKKFAGDRIRIESLDYLKKLFND